MIVGVLSVVEAVVEGVGGEVVILVSVGDLLAFECGRCCRDRETEPTA